MSLTRISLIAFSAVLTVASWPSRTHAVAFLFEFIDTGQDVGRNSSLTLDELGDPHVAYWDFASNDLEYAKRTAGIWQLETVDSPGAVGQLPSIALDSDGDPRIAYLEIEDNPIKRVLKYAEKEGGIWNVTRFDTTDQIGTWASLALDSNDDPRISTENFTHRDLIYLERNAGIWTFQTVDTTGFVGANSSLALDASGDPHISYYDLTNQDLKYATRSGGLWTIERVDSIGGVGSSSSIAIDSQGNPHIAYYDATVGALKYAVRELGVWSADYVDPNGNTGVTPSLALDSEDNPHVSYHEADDDDLLYAHREGGVWSITKIDSVSSVGFDCSIALTDNDLPRISYYDFGPKNLKFAEGVHPIKVPQHFGTIQQAIDPAEPGDSILVAGGSYSGPGNRDLNFRGKDLVVAVEEGTGAATIFCGSTARGFALSNGETEASIIDGFFLSGSHTGAFHLVGASPTIRNCDVSGIVSGTGFFMINSSSLVENCVVHDNTQSNDGLAAHVSGGSPIFRGCEFVNNQEFSTFGRGGAVYLELSTALIDSCRFTFNYSGTDGGAIFLGSGADATIRKCTFESNRAGLPVTGKGGAIYGNNASPSIIGSTLRANHAVDGGAIALESSLVGTSAEIEDCLITGNDASDTGGGIWLDGYTVDLIGNTIADNVSDRLGGGIHFADDDTAWVERTIIWGNCAAQGGDEIYFDEILPGVDVHASFTCSNVDSSGFAGPGSRDFLGNNLSEDPVFVEGGVCDFLFPPDEGYNLDCGSPCLASVSPCGETIGSGEEACTVDVDEEPPVALSFRLLPATPNPFSGSTSIQFEIPVRSWISLNVYDLRGRRIRNLGTGLEEPGRRTVTWDGRADSGDRMPSGMYFLRLEAGGETMTRRLVLLGPGG